MANVILYSGCGGRWSFSLLFLLSFALSVPVSETQSHSNENVEQKFRCVRHSSAIELLSERSFIGNRAACDTRRSLCSAALTVHLIRPCRLPCSSIECSMFTVCGLLCNALIVKYGRVPESERGRERGRESRSQRNSVLDTETETYSICP